MNIEEMAEHVTIRVWKELCEGYEAEYKKDDVIIFLDTPSEELSYEEAKAAVRYFRYQAFKLLKKHGEI